MLIASVETTFNITNYSFVVTLKFYSNSILNGIYKFILNAPCIKNY